MVGGVSHPPLAAWTRSPGLLPRPRLPLLLLYRVLPFCLRSCRGFAIQVSVTETVDNVDERLEEAKRGTRPPDRAVFQRLERHCCPILTISKSRLKA
jgi:hypothetical protein